MRLKLEEQNGREFVRISGRVHTVYLDRRGRRQVWLGYGHPWANRGGFNWLPRVRLAARLGYMPPGSVHAHHRDRDRSNDAGRNIVAIDGRRHLQLEARGRRRDRYGRFLPV